jgi:ABC-2 type transport system ATP-binding protein
MQSIIRIEDIHYQYEQKPALNGIKLSIGTGELHGLIGPDSAGKTTLMRLLCGLLSLQTGEAFVFDLPVRTAFRQIRARIGYMPQRFSLYQDLSVQENLLFFARLFSVPKAERDKRLPELYAFSRLEPFKTRRASALSGGMKQKLALSCALVHRPELLILDEPTYGVDPVSRQEFWQMLKSIQQEGTSILISTPYMDEAELCDKVSLIFTGNLLATDTPEQIKSSWKNTVYQVAGHNLRQLEAQLQSDSRLASCQMFGNELHLVIADAKAETTIKALAEQYKTMSFEYQKVLPNMEDVFLSYMKTGGK